METLIEENAGNVTVASVGRQVLSLAGDALCIAATALRLAALPKPSSVNEEANDKYSSTSTPVLRSSAKDGVTDSTSLHFLLPEVSLAEVAWHDCVSDCWIVVYDLVYDVTKFLQEHPGGEEVIMEYAGRDASLAFRSVNHGPAAFRALERCLVGRLPDKERIFGPRVNAKIDNQFKLL